MQTNIMSVDLEDYYCDLPFSEWPKYESRVVENTGLILDLFTKHDVKATFFVVGYIAELFPELIKEISEKGHEIASHSHTHMDIRKSNPIEFENDLVKSIVTLENIIGKKILGFRAPFFSIDSNSFWAMKILKKHIKYDASIFPVRTPLYGIPNAPRIIYNPSLDNPAQKNESESLIEIPAATHRLPILGNIPIAGGFHLRFLPYRYIRYGIKKMNNSGNPAMIYIHPKDLDHNMPKIKGYGWNYYYNLKNARNKFEKLLSDFKFTTAEKILNLE